MTTPVFTYQRPGVTVVPSAPAQTIAPSTLAGNTVVVLGRFPQGPRFPTLVDAVGASSVFGAASSTNSTYYDGPLSVSKMALQRNPTSYQAITYLILRVGVTPATVQVLDGSSAVCFTLSGEGAYAGTNGLNLAYSVTLSGPAVAAISIFDTSSGSPVLLQQFVAGRNNLQSNQSIVNEINGANPTFSITGAATGAIVSAVVGASSSLPAAVNSPVNFTGSPLDGAAATASDSTIGTLLNQSLKYNAQFIVPLFDAASIASTIQTHQSAAQAALQWRFAYMGPQIGTSYSSLSSNYFSAAATPSSQVSLVAHDAYLTSNPVTGLPLVVPGYIFAAAACALKASGPVQETTTKQYVIGFSNIQTAPGKTGPLTVDEQNALAIPAGSANNGQIVTSVDPSSGQIQINHALTTAPYNLNGVINAFSEVNAQTVDNTYNSMLVNQSQQLIGRVYKSASSQRSAVLTAVNTGASALDSSGAINGYVHTVARDPETGLLTVGATYGLPVGTNYIEYQSGGVQLTS